MTNCIFILSIIFLAACLGLALKPSPIYGGLSLIISGCAGCLVVLGFGGSFLGLLVFLVYMGGMLVVFGYTTAMAMEEYPETWGSNWLSVGGLILGVLLELGVIIMCLSYEEVGLMIVFDNAGGWLIYEGEGVGLMGEGGAGVAALYSCSTWLMVVAGWTLFMGIYIIIEITRE